LRNFATLTRMRIQLTLRNKMFLFFSVIMPFGFFFLYAGVFAKGQPLVVQFFLGPVVALTVMGSFWGLSAALVMFREQGILRRFHVTPVTPSDMLASSIVANYVLTFPTVLLEFVFARSIFHVTNFGDLLATFILISIGTVSFASLGLVVASVTNTMQETQVINQLLWLPLIFLSGATFPLAFLPKVVQKVSLFLPATYLVQGLRRSIFEAAPIWDHNVLISLGSLVCWAVLTFFLSAQLFRWEPEVKVRRNAKLLVVATAIPFLLLGLWENKFGNIPAQAQSAFDSLNGQQEKSAPPPDSQAQPNAPK
jgi:ABC-2 type transport system permease protein